MLRFLTITTTLSLTLSVPAFAANSAPEVPAGQATAVQSTMIVLDGSNSMWGQLEGVNKIVTARESLRTLLENAHDSINFGLLTYGNSRRKNGCTDFTLVSKPQDYDMVTLLKEVYRVKPAGRSPIAEALKHAAKNLPRENPHILLVSDGEESCRGDPCAVAKKLAADNPDLQIDVIGFRDEKSAQLECIAENGRGAFVFARDTQRLKTLLAGVQAKAQAIRQSPQAPASLSEADKTLPGSVELGIRSDNAQTEPLRANYSIYTPDGANVVSFTARTQVKEYLKPGTYRIKAIWQNKVEESTITIQSGQTSPHTFNVGPTGTVQVNAVNKAQKPLPVNYAIYSRNGDFISKHIMQDAVKTRLPLGEYRVKAILDDQTEETELKVTADSQTSHTFRFERK